MQRAIFLLIYSSLTGLILALPTIPVSLHLGLTWIPYAVIGVVTFPAVWHLANLCVDVLLAPRRRQRP